MASMIIGPRVTPRVALFSTKYGYSNKEHTYEMLGIDRYPGEPEKRKRYCGQKFSPGPVFLIKVICLMLEITGNKIKILPPGRGWHEVPRSRKHPSDWHAPRGGTRTGQNPQTAPTRKPKSEMQETSRDPHNGARATPDPPRAARTRKPARHANRGGPRTTKNAKNDEERPISESRKGTFFRTASRLRIQRTTRINDPSTEDTKNTNSHKRVSRSKSLKMRINGWIDLIRSMNVDQTNNRNS